MIDDGAVVITGLGIVSTIGETPLEFFNALVSGRSGITRREVVGQHEYSMLLGDMSGFDRSFNGEPTRQEEPDPALDLDFVPNVARPQAIDVALSNSFGFGGLSTSLVLGRAL